MVHLNVVQTVRCVHTFNLNSDTLRGLLAQSSGAQVEATFMKFYKLCIGVETAVLQCTVGQVCSYLICWKIQQFRWDFMRMAPMKAETRRSKLNNVTWLCLIQ